MDVAKYMKLIVGLGNHGSKYVNTRHNIGYRTVRLLHTLHIMEFDGWKSRFKASVSEGQIGGEKVVLMLPETFMNNSGDAVIQAVNFWKLEPADVIIVSDDLTLPLGQMRIRTTGGSGGQNGLKSVIQRLGTEDVPRLRVGIGNEGSDAIPAENFVLQRFSGEEMPLVEETARKAGDAINTIVGSGIDVAMNQFNEKKGSS